MKPALMIIDMQKAFFKASSKASMIAATEYINEVIGYFREKELPIVWVQDMNEDSGVVPTSKGFEIMDVLHKSEEDIYIYKKYGNAFNKTDCAQLLIENDIDLIVMSGYCAEHCVLSSYRGAQDLDFTPVLLKNGVASGDTNNIQFVENISDTIPYNLVKSMLSKF